MKQPAYAYTPFGYLDNPAHCVYLHNSGVIRSVPPLGMGFWRRGLPWTYASSMGPAHNNYLAFLKLALVTEQARITTMEEGLKEGLCSRRHTDQIMSYDWEGHGLSFTAEYALADEETIVCRWVMRNSLTTPQKFTLRASNLFGYIERGWWGSTGFVSRFVPEKKAWICKIYEGGDIFVLYSDDEPSSLGVLSYKVEEDSFAWSGDKLNGETFATTTLENHAAQEAQSDYSYEIAGNSERKGLLILVRERNEAYAWSRLGKARQNVTSVFQERDAADEKFYSGVPVLTGAWSDAWKQGWIQDFETLRMTVRPPVGIYTTPWDSMQIFSPRCVLGETHLDMMCYSFANPEIAKEVIYGCFKDAPMPNVPCSREDGSMNMIGAGGSECGTSPVWGLPFYVIRSLFFREHDIVWLRKLYPYLRSFICWWLENRTDAEGWFHCNNSWESGQDGSKRFTFEGGSEADEVNFVRTVDVEAVMAHAMETMAVFARHLGLVNDIAYWEDLAKDRIKRTREMFSQGWFRDFDARNGKPIILKDYYDVMMLLPITVGVALKEQIDEMKSSFKHFMNNPKIMLEWPSFQFPFTEAARRAGLYDMIGDLLQTTGDRVYGRETSRTVRPLAQRYNKATLPPNLRYKMPGQASEFWPLVPDPTWECGAEHYGWGATLPTMVIRNIFGIIENETPEPSIIIEPHLPTSWKEGEVYGMENFHLGPYTFSLDLSKEKQGTKVKIVFQSPEKQTIEKVLKPGENLVF